MFTYPCLLPLEDFSIDPSSCLIVFCGFFFFLFRATLHALRGNDTLTEAFTLVGGPIDENLGGYDVAKGDEHLHELTVSKLLRQVVDEQVAAFGS